MRLILLRVLLFAFIESLVTVHWLEQEKIKFLFFGLMS